MATDLERLVVQLEAQTVKFDRAMAKALGTTNTTMNRIERRQTTAVQRLNAGFQRVGTAIAGAFAGGAALRGGQQLIDTSIRIENALKVAGLAGQQLTAVYDTLFAAAQRNAAPLESLVTLYGRATLVQNELGVSSAELLNFTDKVALALRVAGTDAQTASGALLQLSQALGSGTVRAEEFNSIQEGALPVLQAVAAGLEDAGGSVAKLRSLVIDGKVSSEAFFRAFEAGSVVLEQKVAGSELTVSQSFVRLQNVLVDVARRFNEGTAVSESFARSLDALGNAVLAASESESLNQLLSTLNEFGNANLRGTVREIEAIDGAIQELQQSFDRYGESVSDSELALGEAEQALATFATNSKGRFGEVDAAAQDLFDQILEGRGTAQSAAAALQALGSVNPDFGPLLSSIGGVIQRIYELRGAALAATRPDVSGQPMSYAGQEAGPKAVPKVTTVSLADYAPPAGAGGGGSRVGRSGPDGFADALKSQQQRIDALNRETELMRQLSPLTKDYGYAVERLRAQIELETAAKEAGLALDEPRVQQIEDLSSGYAMAVAEAARLADAQDLVRQAAEDMGQAARGALDSLIDGFIEGKDAGEVLASVVKDLGKNLLNIGLNGLFGGLGGSGGGLFGGLFGGFRANGGPVSAGQAYVVGEKRPELFVPRQSGMILPSIPTMTSRGSGGDGGISVDISIDARGAQQGAGPEIAREMEKVLQRRLPDAIQAYNRNPLRRKTG